MLCIVINDSEGLKIINQKTKYKCYQIQIIDKNYLYFVIYWFVEIKSLKKISKITKILFTVMDKCVILIM